MARRSKVSSNDFLPSRVRPPAFWRLCLAGVSSSRPFWAETAGLWCTEMHFAGPVPQWPWRAPPSAPSPASRACLHCRPFGGGTFGCFITFVTPLIQCFTKTPLPVSPCCHLQVTAVTLSFVPVMGSWTDGQQWCLVLGQSFISGAS